MFPSISPPSAFLLTLFNVLDRFYRERQARSLARSHRVPFLLSPYCLHLVPVSITLAPVRLTGRDDAAASALSRVALLSVACVQNYYDGRNTSADDTGHRRIHRASLGRSLRSSRREKRSIAIASPKFARPTGKGASARSTRAIDRSLDRTSPTFPPLYVHTGFETIRDVSPFLFAIVS